ncbi:Transient receptor putative cation channel sub M member 3, partial [Clonorchis sinensis]
MLECAKYIPSRRSMVNSRCYCGLSVKNHAPNVRLDAVTQLGAECFRSLLLKNGSRRTAPQTERWHVKTHTREMPTNAYGTVEFQGGPHPTRARYVRLHYDTSPETLMHLLLHEWRIRVPNLVISMLGGLANAPLQNKLQRVVQSGLLRAAKTTGAWVITNGLDIG